MPGPASHQCLNSRGVTTTCRWGRQMLLDTCLRGKAMEALPRDAALMLIDVQRFGHYLDQLAEGLSPFASDRPSAVSFLLLLKAPFAGVQYFCKSLLGVSRRAEISHVLRSAICVPAQPSSSDTEFVGVDHPTTARRRRASPRQGDSCRPRGRALRRKTENTKRHAVEFRALISASDAECLEFTKA